MSAPYDRDLLSELFWNRVGRDAVLRATHRPTLERARAEFLARCLEDWYVHGRVFVDAAWQTVVADLDEPADEPES